MTNLLDPAAHQTPMLLVVEDSNEDFEALQRFLKRSPTRVPIQRCLNGDQALAFLHQMGCNKNASNASLPGLIMLDLNLPGTDGREVLCKIKQDARLKAIPVVVFTTSSNPRDVEECYQCGANSYIVKPMNFAQLKQEIQTLINYWFEVVTLPNSPES